MSFIPKVGGSTIKPNHGLKYKFLTFISINKVCYCSYFYYFILYFLRKKVWSIISKQTLPGYPNFTQRTLLLHFSLFYKKNVDIFFYTKPIFNILEEKYELVGYCRDNNSN